MKSIHKGITAVLLLFLAISCSDLEEDTRSLLTLDELSSEGDIVASVAPIYRNMLDIHRQPHVLRTATFGGDDLTTSPRRNKVAFRVFDGFDYGSGENSDIIALPEAWDTYWQTIYFCNTLIDGLKTATATEEEIALGDAEARAFRAYCYLHLVKTWGNVPLIVDGVTPTGDEQRATVVENYEFIENDLLIAEQNLPDAGSESEGRISVSFAKAVFSDLYLTWAGWPVQDETKYEAAAQKSRDIIDAGFHELVPIEELWTLEGAVSRESIFSLRFPADASILSAFPTAFSGVESRGFNDAFPELQFFFDFPEGPRKDFTFLEDIPNRRVRGGVIVDRDPPTIPFEDTENQKPYYRKFTLAEDLTINSRPRGLRPIEMYRYAEILLIYAEAQARIGQTASSIEAFNQVKRRAAGLPYLVPDPTVDVTSATPNEVVDEKGWELAGEYKRWFDLVRTQRVAEVTARRLSDEVIPLTRQPSEAQFIAPIPFSAINLSQLEQNPQGFRIR
ncbi:RagB/SusD family nutrient uptake outer membrane protein [uncultured Croceitalea sp.]|uniref:RagB/SusD family nutrient uptake outer membrane protein n=1 Tax=uncultured Croceitalea sp. TaxID=1798908 RepID=UPI00374E9C89